MQTQKIIYRISTGLLVLGMLATFGNYFFNPAFKIIFPHLGFPNWFRIELGTAKLLGAIAIAIPAIPSRVKEWAYFGFFISFSSALLAHYNAGDPAFNLVPPFLMLFILVTSYLTYHKVTAEKQAI
ncbi:DoxX family protein [Pedobacter sp. L105]|uniref:DoxX family protein n=1 Tax=Pedobacter sp. L105 TaxID=1641871 RepID=UPI00131D3996|nr:DoxX family protein [Pedobacter sp. L105]